MAAFIAAPLIAAPAAAVGFGAQSTRRVSVRAEAASGEVSIVINPSIQKDVEKVVDFVELKEVDKPVTAYCRCWRAEKFPLCDGTHAKHNKATGDNVGPLVLKK
eukprot:TRINITY_DN78179_c0_g1_i1.p2 TRINITY_DN78179_c0_g1~~TRINITY_DN78179_c0_g1_i1.p2  ORF type:complete len:104 (-),score=14.42 TRINITY_DN78179_c0_g1_i1:213-524(-)